MNIKPVQPTSESAILILLIQTIDIISGGLLGISNLLSKGIQNTILLITVRIIQFSDAFTTPILYLQIVMLKNYTILYELYYILEVFRKQIRIEKKPTKVPQM